MADYNVQLETGDVLLFKAIAPYAKVITAVTGGECYHAEIAVNGWGRHWSVGAAGSGVRLRPVSSLLLTGERFRVRRMPDSHTPPAGWQDALIETAIDAVGVAKYDFGTLFAQVFSEVFGPLTKRDPANMPNRVICSEWVSLLLKQCAHFDPCPDYPDQWTTPDDLDRKSRLVTVCDELEFA